MLSLLRPDALIVAASISETIFLFRSLPYVNNPIGISVELSHLKVLAFLSPFSSLQLQHMNLSLV